MLLPRLDYLFDCYVQNNYTIQEGEELMALLLQPENQSVTTILIDDVIENTGSEFCMNDQATDSLFHQIIHQDNASLTSTPTRKSVLLYWKNVAAIAILFLAGTSLLRFDKKNDTKNSGSLIAQSPSPVLNGVN